MSQSGFNAEFLRAWQNDNNKSIDDVVAELNGAVPEGEKPTWDKKKAQTEAARYRKAGVGIRRFSRKDREPIDVDAAADFLASLGEPPEAESIDVVPVDSPLE